MNWVVIIAVVVVIIVIIVVAFLLTTKDESKPEVYIPTKTLSSAVNKGKYTQKLESSGGFTFVLEDNRMVLYGPSQKVLWSVSSSPGNYLVMQSDGNLVLYNSSDKWVWQAGTFKKGVGPYTFNISDYDGTLSIKDKSNTTIKYVFVNNIGRESTTTLRSAVSDGKYMNPLVNGPYSLSLNNGNLELTGPKNPADTKNDSTVLWSPKIKGQTLYMQVDGNLVLYDSTNKSKPVWVTNTPDPSKTPFTLYLAIDGTLSILSKGYDNVYATLFKR